MLKYSKALSFARHAFFLRWHRCGPRLALLLRGVLGLHVGLDVGVGVHVVPELAEERVLVDEVGGEAVEDAALEPAEQPPHGDVGHRHGLAYK